MDQRSGKHNGLNRIHCLYHPLADLIEDHQAGDVICSTCGLVVGDRMIDPSCEWRTFSNEPGRVDPCRTGGSEDVFFHDGNLSTIVEPGSDLSYKSSIKMDSTTRTLKTGFSEISTMAERINASKSIVHHAKNIFKQVYDTDKLKHRSIDAKATASLYIACRQEGVPRTFKEICAVSAVSKKEIGRCFKLILKLLTSSLELITSEDFMSRFCSNLFLSLELQRAATYIAQQAFKMSIVDDRSPITVAAAAIHMVSQASSSKKTLEEISNIAGVGELTIRQCCKQMYPHATELFPVGFVFSTPINQLLFV